MATLDRSAADTREATRRVAATVRAVLFGDRVGVAVFLAALAFVGLYWRVGVFINDNYTIANALVNVAGGHVDVRTVRYGPASGATPGMVTDGTRVYGRNYGLVAAALPFLFAWRAIAAVADPRVAAVGLWSLAVLGGVLAAARIADRRRLGYPLGCLLALGAFGVNLAVATPLADRWLALLALQTSTAVFAGLTAVLLYRLLARSYDRRTAALAGLGVVVATPVGFWATLPKRHVLVGLLALGSLFATRLARERPARAGRFRAAGYAAVALALWVHPPDGVVLLGGFLSVDLLTAPANDRRRLAAAAAGFGLGLVPFLATNALVTGVPVEPPRFLPGYEGRPDLIGDPAPADGTGGADGDGGVGTGAVVGLVGALAEGIAATAREAGTFAGWVLGQLDDRIALLGEGFVGDGSLWTRLYHTVVHSGYIESVAAEDGGQAINLALLESMPLAAPLVAVPVRIARRARARTAAVDRTHPRRATDLLAAAYVGLFVLAYLPRLPLHAMVTVRYLVPVVPLLAYGVVRLPAIRAAIGEGRPLAWSYASTALVGTQLILAVVAVRALSRGEAMQLHAVLALAAAAALGGWTLAATLRDRSSPWVGAVLLGVTAGLSTAFLLLSGLDYFAYAGDFLLPVSGRVSDALGTV